MTDAVEGVEVVDGSTAQEIAGRLSLGLVVVRQGIATWFNGAARALVEPYGGAWAGIGSPTALLSGAPPGTGGTAVQWGSPNGQVRRWQVTSTVLAAPSPDLLYEIVDHTAPTDDEHPRWRLGRLEAMLRLGSWVWEVGEDRIEWSPGLLAMFGLPPNPRLDFPTVRRYIHPDDLPRLESALLGALTSGQSFSLTHRVHTTSGEERVLQCHGEAFTDPAGTPVRLFGAALDVTDEHRARADLAYLAEHDSLTGVANRRRLTARLAECAAGPRGATLLMIDIDHFKDINDVRGHAVGDRVMRRIARTVSARLGAGAMLGRLGGDEFAAVLPHCDAEQGIGLGEQICDAVAADAVVEGDAALRVTVSVGVAPVAGGDDIEVGLARADLALYEAKKAGRNRARLFAPDQYRQAVARVSLLERVGDALDRGTMELDAQPIIDLATGRPVCWEVLIRLRDGLEPALGPADFLPAVERTDLVFRLDRWVVEHTIRALACDNARIDGLCLQVNLSARSLEDDGLDDWILDELDRNGVAPQRLGLEMTETAAITNLDAAQRLVGKLTDAGCAFALDDFGAGFGSFSHLKHLPFTTVKIAGEFVRYVDADRVDQALVTAVVGVAHELGMRVVAERVERAELVAQLRKLGVHDGQGFHLGRPRPLVALLSRTG